MEKFYVTLTFQGLGGQETDTDVTQSVEALDEIEALEKARYLTKQNYPDSNIARIWTWSIERLIYRN